MEADRAWDDAADDLPRPDPEDVDQLAASRGIVLWLLVSLVFWIVLVGILWVLT